MSKETQKLSEILNPPQQSMGAIEPSTSSLSAILSAAKEVGGKIWDEAAPMFDHGKTELAAALFNSNGSAFVMYGHNGKHDQDHTPDHGLPIEAMKQPDMQPEQSMGREM